MYATITMAIVSMVLSIVMMFVHPHFNREGSWLSWIRLSPEGKRVTILEDTLRSLGIAQLVTALALVISAWKSFMPDNLDDPHAALAISQALLASYSHMAPLGLLLGSGNIGKKSFSMRFFTNIITSILATYVYFHPSLLRIGSWPEVAVMMMSVLSCALVVILEGFPLWMVLVRLPGRVGRKEIERASPPRLSWLVVIVSTVGTSIMLGLTIYLKFFSKIRGCDMRNGADGSDGEWGFGQWLAILMLAAVAMSIIEEFTGEIDSQSLSSKRCRADYPATRCQSAQV